MSATSVFVVDDHDVVRLGLGAFLAGHPELAFAGEAAGGHAALAQLASLATGAGLPDVVLMDLVMRDGDGRAAAQSLQLSERTVQTHLTHVMGKLNLASRTQVALWALREGLVDLHDLG